MVPLPPKQDPSASTHHDEQHQKEDERLPIHVVFEQPHDLRFVQDYDKGCPEQCSHAHLHVELAVQDE